MLRLAPVSFLLLVCPILAQDPVLIWMRDGKALQSNHTVHLRGARIFRSLPVIATTLTPDARRLLALDPGVIEISDDSEYRAALVPGVAVSGASYVWQAGFTGRGESVAIIDTGYSSRHPMFAGVDIEAHTFLESGKDHPCFGDDPWSTEDLQGHGTRTASIVAGQALPQYPGYFGAARGIGKLYILKAGFKSVTAPGCPVSDGIFRASDILSALDFVATKTNVKVVNLSIGSPNNLDDDVLAKIVDFYAEVVGLTIAVSAGNNGTELGVNSPGISYNGITVANLDDRGTEEKGDDVIAPTSSRGPTLGLRRKPDLAGPGTRVYAADFASNGLNQATGTSAATPIVSGIAALLRDAGVKHPLAVKALLLNSADRPEAGSWQRDFGWGTINATAAYEQRQFVLSGVASPRRPQYYRGTLTGPAHGMLVWNRHIDPASPVAPGVLRPMSVQIYSRDGSLVSRSDSTRDNVLPLSIPAAGDYVVRVDSPEAAETFGIAWSEAGFHPVALGPKLDFGCSYANPVRVGATLSVTCTAENSGDLDLFGVTGTVAVPPGFSSGGPQSFGNLAPGTSRSNVWVITAPGSPAAYELIAGASTNSYGTAVQAEEFSSRWGVDVVAESPGFVLNPTVVRLSAAASRSALIRTGAAEVRALSTSAAWVRGSVVAGGVLLSLTEAADALLPGVYEAAFFINSQKGRVLLRADPPLPVIETARFAAAVSMAGGCPVPEPIRAASEAAAVHLWFIARGVKPTDVFGVRWFSPSGFAGNSVPAVPATAGDYCFSVPALDPAKRYGEWRAEVSWNGVRQAPVALTVRPEIQFDGETCAIASSTPHNVSLCPSYRGVSEGSTFRYEFVRPDGEVDGRFATPSAGPIEYAPIVPSSGNWMVRVFADEALAGTIQIPIMSGVTVESIAVDGNQFRFSLLGASAKKVDVAFVDPRGSSTTLPADSETAGIDLPQAEVMGRWVARLLVDGIVVASMPYQRLPVLVTDAAISGNSFSVLDARATFTVQVDDAQVGSQPGIEFWQEGVLKARANLDVIPERGPWRLSSGLPIAGAIGAQNPGIWEVRATWTGIEIARQAFEIRRGAIPLTPTSSFASLTPNTPGPLSLKGEIDRI